ncbi:MAG: IS21 family transposase [Rectinemataceae bacterium]
MGYRLVTTELLGVIWAQMKIGETNRAIARHLGIDRKTANGYANKILKLGIPPEASYGEALGRLSALLVENAKAKPSMARLVPLEMEIRDLIGGDRKAGRQPMKAKTAWSVIRVRHSLEPGTSYESFKRFVRERGIGSPRPVATIRIETEPGDEIQIDYGKMGIWTVGLRNRIIQAFIGTLSFSRLPFVHFSTSQDQVSFAESIVAMLAFYGGSPHRITLDNLKSGVLNANIYDPTLNRTFAELCDHYGVLADPARPASPKDKGKVERIVQVVREMWKLLTALHPAATLDELNVLACAWSRDDYGIKRHGTTGIPPRTAFDETERAVLQRLPAGPFVVASWTHPLVHPDQFITVDKKLYGLPATLIGMHVDARSTRALVQIFFGHKLVRSFPVPAKGRAYLPADFTDYGRPFEPGAYASSLIIRAGNYGPQTAHYIRLMLEDGRNLAIRRAQGCLSVIEKYRHSSGFSHVIGQAIAGRVFMPPRLKALFETESIQNIIPFPISEAGKAMGRDAGYYTGSTNTE